MMDAKIVVAAIALAGVISVPIINHYLKAPVTPPKQTEKPINKDLLKIIKQLKLELSAGKEKFTNNTNKLESIKTKLATQIQLNRELKNSFHNINNAKLKQLMSFHNDAICYGPSLNFSHPAGDSFKDCVSKEALAKTFLRFFAELGIIENTSEMEYTPQKAKAQLAKWQIENYQFDEENAGWYNGIMLGYLIIEYAKKS